MEQRPNFIVIHTDQQRSDCVGINGHRKGIYTPYIDSIGYQGVNFTSAYATCPLCIPQRLSLLTGQLPEHHGLFANVGIPYLPLDTTLPTEMRKGGYQTALVGRTMHTYPFELSYGFEYYRPGDPSSSSKEKDGFFNYLNDHSSAEDGGYYGGGPHNNSRAAAPYHLSDDCHQTKWATNRALEFLSTRDASRPFLLFVGYYAPHSPHNPPAEFFNRFYQRNDLGSPSIAPWDVPPTGSGNVMARYNTLSEEEIRSLYAGYYGNIAFLDSQVGRLLQAAMQQRNTYVIFTSDHGEMLGDHYLMQKNRPYQGAVHIPFLMMGPDIADSRTITAPVGWHDIMPTILDLAGLPIPDSVDGSSLVPLLRGQKEAPWRQYIHGECTHDFLFDARTRPVADKHNFVYEKGSQYLTDGRMKYIWYVTSGKEHLFDVENDPEEKNDLSANTAYSEQLAQWRAILVKELAGREEGFSDGVGLVAGRIPVRTDTKMTALMKLRQEEGFALAFQKKKTPVENLEYNNDFLQR